MIILGGNGMSGLLWRRLKPTLPKASVPPQTITIIIQVPSSDFFVAYIYIYVYSMHMHYI